MLTKSLHTITAATNVAAHLLIDSQTLRYGPTDAAELAQDALAVLGHSVNAYKHDDATVARIVANCAKLLAAPTPKTAAAKAMADFIGVQS